MASDDFPNENSDIESWREEMTATGWVWAATLSLGVQNEPISVENVSSVIREERGASATQTTIRKWLKLMEAAGFLEREKSNPLRFRLSIEPIFLEGSHEVR